MGDLNPTNIMVKFSEKVFFVDTDSYQIEDFPCPVGTPDYTAPEIQNRKKYDFLRSIGNENFAVATLLLWEKLLIWHLIDLKHVREIIRIRGLIITNHCLL